MISELIYNYDNAREHGSAHPSRLDIVGGFDGDPEFDRFADRMVAIGAWSGGVNDDEDVDIAYFDGGHDPVIVIGEGDAEPHEGGYEGAGMGPSETASTVDSRLLALFDAGDIADVAIPEPPAVVWEHSDLVHAYDGGADGGVNGGVDGSTSVRFCDVSDDIPAGCPVMEADHDTHSPHDHTTQSPILSTPPSSEGLIEHSPVDGASEPIVDGGMLGGVLEDVIEGDLDQYLEHSGGTGAGGVGGVDDNIASASEESEDADLSNFLIN